MNQQILVTGATGTIGMSLVPLLCANRDIDCRAFVRDTEKARPLADAGAELATGTFDDAHSLAAAMQAVDAVVLIVPPSPQCVAWNAAILDAASSAGVRKVVRISAVKSAEDGRTENTRLHGRCDRLLRESGLDYVILRPNYFMQNIFMSLDSIRNDDLFYAGMSEGRLAMIDARDVAESAAVAATAGDFDNQAFEISGPASISFVDVADALSEVAGRPISYVPISPDDVRASILQMGLGKWTADLLGEYSEAYADGWGDLVTDNVRRITGHAPRSFIEFATEVLAPALG